MKSKKDALIKDLIRIVIILIVIQIFFIEIKEIIFRSAAETVYSRSMVTMISMLVALAVLIFYCYHNNYCFTVFPKTFGSSYIVATLFAVSFYIITLFFVKSCSLSNVSMMIYGSLVTPVFEELLFRGVIWNRLNNHFSQEWKTYLTVTFLFALWHMGYAVGLYLWNGGNLIICIIMKVMIGAIYGLIIGAIRWKTKNCYCGILVHGILNALG